MKRILFVTNYPSPYRVNFFDELGKHLDVTVLFSDRIENKTHRDARWYVEQEGNFQSIQLKTRVLSLGGKDLCLDVCQWLSKPWDAIVICGYSGPTVMLAIGYLKIRGIPFYMEVDGGLIRPDSPAKYRFKRSLVSAASWWISSGSRTTDYLCHYGARRERVFDYPFTSLWQREIPSRIPSQEEKKAIRRELGMTEEKIVLYVGRFTREKGMDALLQAAAELDENTGVYFVGGEPEERHRDFVNSHGLNHVHFVEFKKKEDLAAYYQAADLFVLPTHSDVWGLVINEAMACGLPVITTDRCVAGLELVEDGVNGYLVPVEDIPVLTRAIETVFAGDFRQMGAAALEKIRPYTMENMVRAHLDIWEGGK